MFTTGGGDLFIWAFTMFILVKDGIKIPIKFLIIPYLGLH